MKHYFFYIAATALISAPLPPIEQINRAEEECFTQCPGIERKNAVSYGKELFLKGINDFNEGDSFLEKGNPAEANGYFERVAEVFLKAYDALKGEDLPSALQAIKCVGEARLRQGTPKALNAGIATLDTVVNDPLLLGKMENPDEIFYLKGAMAEQLAVGPEKEKYFSLAKEALQQGLAAYPDGHFADDILYMIGTLYYRQGDSAAAETAFLKLASKTPTSPLTGDALYWAAMSAEKLNKPKQLIQSYRRRLIEEHPQSSLAAEAYFLCYSYADYLQGDRAAIKHLQGMRNSYPDSPYLLNAYYLIGLDYKRDRKTPEGKWIRKRNLTAAIDAFNEVESFYDSLLTNKQIPEELHYSFLFLRYRATLERALANLAIANESVGAKREIYLEYAEEVFQEMLYDMQEKDHPLASSSIQEEAMHWLTQTYLEAGNVDAADATAVAMLERYASAKTTRGYYLSRLWYQRGVGALRRGNAALALDYYNKAEEAGRGKVLSVDQKLDLWIQQSACFLAMGQFDEAMLLLSKVINEDAVSGLRLKAMYLRAEVYEKQGRRELARNQLEATMKKGGEWAAKAKQKLEQEYAK